MSMNSDKDDDLGLSPEFLMDEDIARDIDEYDAWHRPPKCGGSSRDEYGQEDGCLGCRHCSPPDHETKPYGFGIERFEQEAILNRARQLLHWWPMTCPITWERARELAFKWSGYDVHLERRSERYWERCCDECETHRQAVEWYSDWAKKAVKKRRRDEG